MNIPGRQTIPRGVPVGQDDARSRSRNGAAGSLRSTDSAKQRITIALPVTLLERLRNAVYWSGQGPLARLISDALLDAVTELEEANGGRFPTRLAPLKRGRPRVPPLPPRG